MSYSKTNFVEAWCVCSTCGAVALIEIHEKAYALF